MATPTINDYFLKVGQPGTATTLSAPGYTAGGNTINVASTGSFPTDTAVIFAIDTVGTSTGSQVENTGSYCIFVGIVTSATSIGSLSLLYGTPQNYAAAATTRVFITVSSQHTNRLITGLLQFANQNGTLIPAAVTAALATANVTTTGTITATSFVQTGGSSSNGWNVGVPAPNTVTYNGNRSYSIVFNASDQTGALSPGMRLRTTRTVAAPTQCTSLNGTTQYYSKTSPAGMTFTNNFVVSAWVKLTSYPGSIGVIASRYNGTSGYRLIVNSSGQVILVGHNASSANFRQIGSYQSIPLNKWVHVAIQLDMSSYTATTTTCYVMIDGVDVPGLLAQGGTNPTALVQAGNLEIGSENSGTNPFPGKIAQVAVFSAKVTESTMQGYISQGLAGTETSLISAYSFNNTINDLNTTNANNLTANNGAVATTVDSPFSQQDGGTPNGTLDYGIVQSVSFSTNTTAVIQVPEGCTIPTTGGVSAVVYSSQRAPYGFPSSTEKWKLDLILRTNSFITTSPTSNTLYNPSNILIQTPIGEWRGVSKLSLYTIKNTGGTNQAATAVGTTTSTVIPESVAGFYGTTQGDYMQTLTANFSVSMASMSPLYVLLMATTSGISTLSLRPDINTNNVTAGADNVTLYNAYL